MQMIYDDEALKAGQHVRIEFNGDRTEIQIGTTGGTKPGFLDSFPLIVVDRERVRTAQDLATAVDYYCKTYRVSRQTTASTSIMRTYRLVHGRTINGLV